MTISPTGSAPSSGLNAIAVASLKKALNQQKQAGEAAVQLIQQAGQVAAAAADPSKGTRVNVFA